MYIYICVCVIKLIIDIIIKYTYNIITNYVHTLRYTYSCIDFAGDNVSRAKQ